MPHPKLLNDLQIAKLVEDRIVNSTPFRVLGSRFGISASTAFNYWQKYGKDTNSINGMGEQIKADTSKAQTLQDEDLEAEILSWQEWFSHIESSQASVSPSESYRHKCGQTSHGHNGAGEGAGAGIAANTAVRKNDNGEPFKPDNSVLKKCSPHKLEPSHVFTSPSVKKKR